MAWGYDRHVHRVAHAREWYFVFSLDIDRPHVVLDEKMWRVVELMGHDDLAYEGCPLAIDVFRVLNLFYNPADDYLSGETERTLPDESWVREFAQGLGKTIHLCRLGGRPPQGVRFLRLYTVSP